MDSIERRNDAIVDIYSRIDEVNNLTRLAIVHYNVEIDRIHKHYSYLAKRLANRVRLDAAKKTILVS